LHIDMANNDWVNFEEHEESIIHQHHTETFAGSNKLLRTRSLRALPSSMTGSERTAVLAVSGLAHCELAGDQAPSADAGKHAASTGDAAARKRRASSMFRNGALGLDRLPQELQLRVPALQTAQAVGRLLFYEPKCASPELGAVLLPKDMAEDLRVSFLTFRQGEGKDLLWTSVRTALMYAGIFEDPPESSALAATVSEAEFMALGHDLLLAKFDEAHIKKTNEIFHKYDVDGSGTLDMSELANCFAETIHPNVSAEEIESLANAWAHPESGQIDQKAFMAIMARFVRKHQHDWNIWLAFQDILGEGSGTEANITTDMLLAQAALVQTPLTRDEAEEMLWAASIRGWDDKAETEGVDFGSFMSIIFAHLGEITGRLPPAPWKNRKEGNREATGRAASKRPPPQFTILHNPVAGEDAVLINAEGSGQLFPKTAWDDPTATSEATEGGAANSLRARLNLVFEEPGSSPAAMWWAIFMLVVILLSVFVLVLEPLASGSDKDTYSDTEKTTWTVVEIVFTAIFGFELFARGCVASAAATWDEIENGERKTFRKNKTFVKWIREPGTICDFAAVLPYFTDLAMNSAGGSFKLLLVIRMLRIGRVMRISRMAKLAGRVSDSGIGMELLQSVSVVMVVIWGIYLKYSDN